VLPFLVKLPDYVFRFVAFFNIKKRIAIFSSILLFSPRRCFYWFYVDSNSFGYAKIRCGFSGRQFLPAFFCGSL
jgi:hypothetical protein